MNENPGKRQVVRGKGEGPRGPRSSAFLWAPEGCLEKGGFPPSFLSLFPANLWGYTLGEIKRPGVPSGAGLERPAGAPGGYHPHSTLVPILGGWPRRLTSEVTPPKGKAVLVKWGDPRHRWSLSCLEAPGVTISALIPGEGRGCAGQAGTGVRGQTQDPRQHRSPEAHEASMC